ncbi:MAG TPA: hypothetical protein VKI45_10320 [Allosphingosinicella sp.]|nr:hypothetical protein [Allosphingosinicella sp.]
MKMLLVTGAALAAALAAAPAASAQDAPATKSEKIVIIERAGDHADGAAVHRFRLEDGADLHGNCTGTKDEVDQSSADGRQRTRILVCGNTQLSSAERVEKLEHVLSRLEARDDLSAEQKAKVTAALREVIEKARAGQ